MKMREFFHEKGMEGRTILYLTTLIVSMVCGTGVLLYTGSQFTETMESHNRGILRSYDELIGEHMQEIPLVSYTLLYNSVIQEVAESSTISAELRLEILRLLEGFPPLLAGYPMVSDFFVYFDRSEKILTPTGFYDAWLYYQANVRGDSYEEWKRALQENREQGVYTAEETSLFYTRRDPERGMTVVIATYYEQIEDQCMEQLVTGEGYVGLYGEDGEVLVEAAPGAVEYESGLFVPGEGIYALTLYPMTDYPMILALAMPDTLFTAVLWKAYVTQREVMILMICLAGLSGTLFVYNYYVRPKNSLVAWMRTRGKKTDSTVWELQHSVDSLMEEQGRELQKEREMGRRFLGEAYIMNLLKREEKWTQEVPQKLREYYLNLDYAYVWVMIWQSDNLEMTVYQSGLREIEAMLRHKLFVGFSVLVLEGDTARKTMLLNVERSLSPQEIRSVEEGFSEWLAENQAQRMTLSLGELVKAEDMASSYEKAEETADYFFLYPKAVLLTADILHQHTGRYTYSQETENALIDAAVSRRMDEVMEILQSIWNRNFVRNSLEIRFAKLLLYALLNTLYKVEAIQKKEEKQLYQISPDRLIMSCRDIDEAQEQIEFVFRSLCEEAPVQEISWRMKRILRYIEDHYLERDLSLEQVADHFRITPQYLSGLFKKSGQKNFLTYLALLRVEKAKSLMAQSKLNLAEIAQQSGFTNYLALARAFQKYEGVTPGEYRRNHLDSH